MLQYRTIPKLCRPQVLTTVNPNKSLTDNFNRDYEELFFKHLERVMTNITLEIHKARVDNALAQFDQYLCITLKSLHNVDSTSTRSKEITKEVQLTFATRTNPSPQPNIAHHLKKHQRINQNVERNEKIQNHIQKLKKSQNSSIFYPKAQTTITNHLNSS